MQRLPSLITQDLESGGSVVVPSPQRAAAIQLAFAREQLAAGRRAWRTPEVLGWRTWLEREALRAREAGSLTLRPLGGAEEWLLWRQVLAAVLEVRDLPFTESLAEAARRSAELLFEWHIPLQGLTRSGKPESELLAAAITELEARAEAQGGLPRHRFASVLRPRLGSRSVTFAGFLERSPARAAVLRLDGQRVREQEPETHAGSAYALGAQDSSEELAWAAAWCRARLEENPSRRLLVIVPDLDTRRDAVLRTLEQALTPASVLHGIDAAEPQGLALEGGEALSEFALVRHALGALRLLSGPLEPEALWVLIRSPFWRAPSSGERAALEAALRRLVRGAVSATDLRHRLAVLAAPLDAAARQLGAALERAQGLLNVGSGTPALSEWAGRYAEALDALGWPGARPLTSAEQQTHGRWLALLAEWGTLGERLGRASATEAAHALERFAQRTAFAPASADSAVTVSAQLTVPVVRYDGIWIAGLHADAWPPPPRIDPFIPLPLQRAAGMPSVSATAMLERARALLDVTRRSATELVVSWPEHTEERSCSPCSLIAELPGVEPLRGIEPATPLARRVRAARRIERYPDAGGLPWPRPKPLPSGTRSLELQSRCAFRAYGELRLACAPPESGQPGVDARERGQLLHRALELLFRRLRDHRTLIAQRGYGGGLPKLIEECVAAAVEQTWPIGSAGAAGVSERARAREARRAVRLLEELAELEQQRMPFEVLALEQRSRIELAGATLDVRIDRVDRLEDGSLAVLDYKTGTRVPQPDWQAERPTEPQLLVYLLAQSDPVAALALVQLSSRHIAYRGASDHPGRLPRLLGPVRRELSWSAQLAHWRASIEQLAADFLAGGAKLDPLAGACELCHLHTLCRIAHASTAPAPQNADV